MSPSMGTIALLLDFGTLTYNVVTDFIELCIPISGTTDFLMPFPAYPQKVQFVAFDLI
jgi:hypothetical protein